MESSSFEQEAGVRPIPVYIAPTVHGSGEINLVDLWRVIARRKAIILFSLLLSLLLVFAYLFLAEPAYKANAYLLPPQQQKIQGLLIDYRGIQGVDVSLYTPEHVYSAFLENLESRGLRREFFETYGLMKRYASGKLAEDINPDRVFDQMFNERLRVQVDLRNTSVVTVSFSDNDPKLAAEWLNQFIDFTNEHTVHQLVSNVNAAIHSEIVKTRFQIDSKLKLAEQRRLDTITTLNEALRVAKALGIQDTTTIPKMTGKAQSELIVNTAQMPLYMRGTKALEAEISVLEARKSDEPFIEGVRDLQERSAFLEGISIDADELSAVTIGAAAKTPYRAEKPRKVPTMLLALVLGSLVGLIGVFLTESLSTRRREREEALT